MVASVRKDIDEFGKEFYRLRFESTYSHQEINYVIEWSKQDSALLVDEFGNFDKEGAETLERWHKEAEAYRHAIGRNDSFLFRTDIYDEVYVNQKLVRKDWNIATGDGPALLEKVKAAFPKEEEIWESGALNVIGTYYAPDGAPLRPPYKNTNSISMYHVQREPSPYLLQSYGIDPSTHTWCPWYGLKYDLETKERMLKIVYYGIKQTENIPRPEGLPEDINPYWYFFADIYHEDGSKSQERDIFLFATEEIFRPWCEKYGHTYPIPDEKLKDDIWCYGIVYDFETLEVKQVKGYIRYRIDGI
jgi:hypothetical protein|tara:strand:- start:936 stop:1844 length:909 start_codon:yes stop_codon:yes gene_type:complete